MINKETIKAAKDAMLRIAYEDRGKFYSRFKYTETVTEQYLAVMKLIKDAEEILGEEVVPTDTSSKSGYSMFEPMDNIKK